MLDIWRPSELVRSTENLWLTPIERALETSELNLVVAGTQDAVMMVRGWRQWSFRGNDD